MRFGLSDGQPKTLDEIGKVYGVTRERIRQIEKLTMDKLRHPSRSDVLRDYLDEIADRAPHESGLPDDAIPEPGSNAPVAAPEADVALSRSRRTSAGRDRSRRVRRGVTHATSSAVTRAGKMAVSGFLDVAPDHDEPSGLATRVEVSDDLLPNRDAGIARGSAPIGELESESDPTGESGRGSDERGRSRLVAGEIWSRHGAPERVGQKPILSSSAPDRPADAPRERAPKPPRQPNPGLPVDGAEASGGAPSAPEIRVDTFVAAGWNVEGRSTESVLRPADSLGEKSWTYEEQWRLLEMYERGLPISQIAAHLRLHPGEVSARAVRLLLAPAGSIYDTTSAPREALPLTAREIRRIRRAWSGGRALEAIALEFGRTQFGVGQVLLMKNWVSIPKPLTLMEW